MSLGVAFRVRDHRLCGSFRFFIIIGFSICGFRSIRRLVNFKNFNRKLLLIAIAIHIDKFLSRQLLGKSVSFFFNFAKGSFGVRDNLKRKIFFLSPKMASKST